MSEFNEVFNEVVAELIHDEGYRGNPYKDNLGFDTIGIGTKLPLTFEESELIARHRLKLMVKELQLKKPLVLELPLDAKLILLNMAYQLGVPKLMMFKNMWKALEEKDFKQASIEMKDSLWNKQTPSRSNKLASIMKDVYYA